MQTQAYRLIMVALYEVLEAMGVGKI